MRPRRRDDQHPQDGRPSGQGADGVQAGVVGPVHVVGEDRDRARRGQALCLGDRGADGVGLGPPAGVGEQGADQREVTPPVGLVGARCRARGSPDVAAPRSPGAAGCSCRCRPGRQGARTRRGPARRHRRPRTAQRSPPIAPPRPAPRDRSVPAGGSPAMPGDEVSHEQRHHAVRPYAPGQPASSVRARKLMADRTGRALHALVTFGSLAERPRRVREMGEPHGCEPTQVRQRVPRHTSPIAPDHAADDVTRAVPPTPGRSRRDIRFRRCRAAS